jgi:phage antirepressor YoqD-like protein
MAKAKISSQTFSMSEAGKLINFPGGEHKFFEWLRRNKFFLKDNTPSQAYRDREWFTTAKKVIEYDGVLNVCLVTRCTIKGLAGLEKIKNKIFPPCKPCKDGK